jgi:predicted DsbA family dithiol-disulfide isomerase
MEVARRIYIVSAPRARSPQIARCGRFAAAAQETYKVNSTPTFIIGKETISGTMSYENFKKVFDRALSK